METKAYFHYDGLGSVTNVTDSQGLPQWSYSYDAFGNSRSATKINPLAPDNPMRFTGEYLDPTGLYHLRARQYDPGLGRFTATDPRVAPPSDPYGSTCGYVRNRPTVFIDPSGMTPAQPNCADPGYLDFNFTGVFVIGGTVGLIRASDGWHLYVGGGLVTPGAGGAVTWSPNTPSQGWNVAAQAQAGFAGQGGYGFGEWGGGFGELGGRLAPRSIGDRISRIRAV